MKHLNSFKKGKRLFIHLQRRKDTFILSMPITPLMRKLAFELKQDFSFLAAGKKAENFIITAQGKKKNSKY